MPDPTVVTPQGSPDELAAWTHARFRGATGAMGDCFGAAGEERVRLGVLDTAASGSAVAVSVGHGRSLFELARGMLCASTTDHCLVDVHSRLAMPLTTTRDSPSSIAWRITTGGDYGSLGWLAQAIRREVMAAEGGRLVLNLSLGWTPSEADLSAAKKGDLVGVSPDVLAVYAALRDAQCRGAIIVAAAGNDPGKGGDGPLLPAAWAFGTALPSTWMKNSQDGCTALLGHPPPANLVEDGSPVLYSASGLRASGGDLATTRPDSRSAFVADADHATWTDDPAVPPVTGTSVAALVISASAAARWARDPSASATEVMQGLHATAVPTSRPMGKGYPATSVASNMAARVSLYTAVCEPENLSDCCRPPPPDPPVGSVLADPVAFVPSSVTCPSGGGVQIPKGPSSLAVAQLDCAEDTMGTLFEAPWVRPQPPGDPCPPCNFLRGATGGGVVRLDYSVLPSETQLRRATVTFRKEGSLPQRFEFGLSNQRIYQFGLPGAPSAFDSVTLTTVMVDGVNTPEYGYTGDLQVLVAQ